MRRYHVLNVCIFCLCLPTAAIAENTQIGEALPLQALYRAPGKSMPEQPRSGPGQFFPLKPSQTFRPLPRHVPVVQEQPLAPTGATPTLPSEMTREQAEQIISIFATPD